MAELAPINHFPYMWYKKSLLATWFHFEWVSRPNTKRKFLLKPTKEVVHIPYIRGKIGGMFTFFYLLHMKGGGLPPLFHPTFTAILYLPLGARRKNFFPSLFMDFRCEWRNIRYVCAFVPEGKKVGWDCARAVKTYFEPVRTWRCNRKFP